MILYLLCKSLLNITGTSALKLLQSLCVIHKGGCLRLCFLTLQRKINSGQWQRFPWTPRSRNKLIGWWRASRDGKVIFRGKVTRRHVENEEKVKFSSKVYIWTRRQLGFFEKKEKKKVLFSMKTLCSSEWQCHCDGICVCKGHGQHEHPPSLRVKLSGSSVLALLQL